MTPATVSASSPKRCRRTLARAFGAAFMLAAGSAAGEARYQAIPVGPGYEFGSEKVMILDTESGHLWIWVESPASKDRPGGRYLIYQGQARPGREAGEIVSQQRWEAGE